MSTINGYIKSGQLLAQAQAPVQFVQVHSPIIVGNALITTEIVSARTNGVGFFSVVLAMGDWWMDCLGARVMISVPDDEATYDFRSRVVGAAVFNPSLPPGGADPNATTVVLGLVKTHVYEASPVVPTYAEMVDYVAAHGGGGGGGGAIPAFDTLATLKAAAVPANGVEVILTGISAADDLIASEGRVRRYLYRSGASLAGNDGGVVTPTAGVGRYIQI